MLDDGSPPQTDRSDNEMDPAPDLVAKPAGCLPYALAVVGVAAVMGALAASVDEDPELIILLGNLVTAALAAAWVWYDAQWRGFPLPRLYAIGTFLLAVVFFPLYLFKSRGRSAWPMAAAATGLFLLTIVLSEGLYALLVGPN